MLFATLAMEREPLSWGQFPLALSLWAQNAGGIAVLGLTLWVLARLAQREPLLMLPTDTSLGRRRLLTNLFVLGAVISIAGYGFVALIWLGRTLGMESLGNWFPRAREDMSLTVGDYCLLVGGLCAIALVAAPIVWSFVTRIRLGRIWAIARLSLKEAIRGRVVWIFGAMALVFLFADWFVPHRAEDQLRNYVRVVYWSLTPLFLLTACLLGSFSIPTDVKNNSIHTIVTKPTERFEIVLGRFLGFAILLTVGLFVVSCLSLVYVVRGVNEEAAFESYKARDVLYGQLHFEGKNKSMRAESVGREWGYRSYISGPTYSKPNANQIHAIWDFASVPNAVAERAEPTRFEFAFDIFRLSKGEEGKGIFCTFTFTDGTRQASELKPLVQTMEQERDRLSAEPLRQFQEAVKKNSPDAKQKLDQALDEINRTLVKKYRLYQVKGVQVTDYHTLGFEVPSFVFKDIFADDAARHALGAAVPMLRTFLSVDISKESQMLGVARQDFYLLASEKPFWINFLKGIIGLWCTYMLVLGVAIACSTYLSSVITMLTTLFLYVCGLCNEYLREVAERKLDGGGPMESTYRVANQTPLALRLEDSPTTAVVKGIDNIFSWWIGRFMNLVPDMNRFDLHQYVANGFDIGWTDLLFLDNIVPLVGYLLPWAILAYYLMKYREIANPS